jgi:ssDNA-binding Zn-finger/Zn-ribbon topoisomerase 1
MDTRNVSCPRCGCEVRLAWTRGAEHLGHANLEDGPELVCLDLCDCEDGSCPLSGERSMVMAARLARSGLAPERFRRVRLRCGGCGEEREMEVLSGSRARCTVCGGTSPWVADELLGGVT